MSLKSGGNLVRGGKNEKDRVDGEKGPERRRDFRDPSRDEPAPAKAKSVISQNQWPRKKEPTRDRRCRESGG